MWQPIKTAPKDGTTILIAGKYGSGTWYVEESYHHPSGHFSGRRLDPPTHWMPLPAPPSTEPMTAEKAEDLTRRAT